MNANPSSPAAPVVGLRIVWGVPEKWKPVVGLEQAKIRWRARPARALEGFVRSGAACRRFFARLDPTDPDRWHPQWQGENRAA
jgi:hypothetical protein